MFIKPLQPVLRAPLSKILGGGEEIWLAASQIVAEAGSGFGGAGQWRPSNSGVQTMTIDAGFTRRPGVPTIKIDASVLSPTGAYFRTFRKAIATAALTGAYEMWVWVPPTTAGGHSFIVKAGSDVPADPPIATPANRIEQTFTNDKFQSGYWTCLFWHANGKLYTNAAPNGVVPVVTGSPDLNSIKEIEFDWSINTDTPAVERYMYLDVVAFNGKSRPKLIMGFDGFGDASHSSIVLPKWLELGLGGYFAGDGDSAVANTAHLNAAYVAGSDIPIQGIGHVDYRLNPTELSADWDEADDIVAGDLGFDRERSSRLFAYPFNSRSLVTDATLRTKGVRWGRTTGGNRFPVTSLGKPEMLAMGALDMGTRTAAQIKAWIDDAILCGYSLCLYDHTPVEAVFNEVMTYVATKRDAGLIDPVTPSQFASFVA